MTPAIARTVSVSDHALLRYLERVKGIDVEAPRREVADICGIAAALGVPNAVRDHHVFVVENYVVKTVLPKHGKASKRSRPQRSRYAVAAGQARP